MDPVYVPNGPNYECGLCGAVIPDGADVHGVWNGDRLTGVQVVDSNGEVVHQCGGPVDG